MICITRNRPVMQDNVNAGKFIRNPERHMPGQRTRMQGVALALMFLPLLASAIGKEKVEYCFHTPFDLYLTPVEAYAMKLQQPDTILLVDTYDTAGGVDAVIELARILKRPDLADHLCQLGFALEAADPDVQVFLLLANEAADHNHPL